MLQLWSIVKLRDALLGKACTDDAFVSVGMAKGKGLDGAIEFEIYCPRGTQMMMLEPFSLYGKGARSASWDGKSSTGWVSQEAEVLLQCGGKYRVVDICRVKGKLRVKIEVVEQHGYKKFFK